MPKVLLVEDDEISRDVLVRRRERRGFDVFVTPEPEGSLRREAAI